MTTTTLHDRIAEQAWGVLVASDPPEGAAVNIIAHAIANNVQTVIADEVAALADAYPFDVFLPISRSDTHRAQAALEAIGLTLDRFSAQASRAAYGKAAKAIR